MSPKRLDQLFAKRLRQRLSAAEQLEWNSLVLDPALQQSLQQLLDQWWEQGRQTESLTEEELQQLFGQVSPAAPVRRMYWKRWVAAASILFLVALGMFYFTRHDNEPKPALAGTNVQAPTLPKAMITTTDGKTVYLDALSKGAVVEQGNGQFTKLDDGRISYTGGNGSHELVYNTLTNPRGSTVIDLVLSDGTHVWLNAGSSLTYPVTFSGNERGVTISGEGYFEVQHDAARPFLVKKGEMQVQVLGTHFNVNAYDDEEELKVTLLEGSVKVKNQSSEAKIKPGQQARVPGAGSSITVSNNADLAEVMAWKNGIFRFNEASIGQVMRQIEKWYDVEVVYQGAITHHFVATLPRTLTAKDALTILEQTGAVHFKIENKKIYVMP